MTRVFKCSSILRPLEQSSVLMLEGSHPSLCISIALHPHNSTNLILPSESPVPHRQSKSFVQCRNKHPSEKKYRHSRTVSLILVTVYGMWPLCRRSSSYSFSRYIQRLFMEKTVSSLMLCMYVCILLFLVKCLLWIVYKGKWQIGSTLCASQALCCAELSPLPSKLNQKTSLILDDIRRGRGLQGQLFTRHVFAGPCL